VTYEVFIKLGSSSYYKLTNISQLTIKHNSPVSSMPLPEEVADSAILMKIEGNSETVSLSWVITHSTVGLSGTSITHANGEWGLSGIETDPLNDQTKTIFEQLYYLKSKMPTSVIDTLYQIILLDNADSANYESVSGGLDTINKVTHLIKTGIILDLTASLDSNNPVTINASIEFMVGMGVIKLNLNRSGAPTITDVTSPSAGQLRVVYDDFPYASASDKPATTGGAIKVRYSGGFMTVLNKVNTVNTQPVAGIGGILIFTGLASGTYISLYLALLSDNSSVLGSYSNERIMSVAVT